MKLLTILGVTFVSLFGAGHKAPSKIDTSDTPIKQNQPKYKKITLNSDYIADKETNYLFVAKNYEDNGNGSFYNGSMTKENSYHFDLSLYGQNWQGGAFASCYVLNSTHYTYSSFAFAFGTYTDEATSQLIYYLNFNYLYDNENDFTSFVYDLRVPNFYRANCSFICKGITTTSSYFPDIVNDLYDIYIFEEASFTFITNFNFNAPFNFALDSPFVNVVGQTKTYDLPWFYVNGLAFNQIKLIYVDGASTRYIDQNGVLQINTDTSTSFYSIMQYVNTATNYAVLVNTRNFATASDSNGNLQTYLATGTKWVNDSYRTITFSDTLTPQQLDNLSQFNTNINNGYSDYTSGVVTDIGLASVFSLIGSAFASVSGFLSIQIMPGLTLGLLLFTPLIVGIILAIVWLVKR